MSQAARVKSKDVTGSLKIAGQSVAFLLIAGLLALLIFQLTHQAHALRVGSLAPNFTLLRLDTRREVQLSSFRGRTVVINFWASWCPPCKQEAPLMESVFRRYRKAGVAFLGIDFHDLKGDAARFVAAHGLTFPILEDGSGNVTTRYGVSAAPETFVINRKGRLTLHIAGPVNRSILRQDLVPALRAALS